MPQTGGTPEQLDQPGRNQCLRFETSGSEVPNERWGGPQPEDSRRAASFSPAPAGPNKNYFPRALSMLCGAGNSFNIITVGGHAAQQWPKTQRLTACASLSLRRLLHAALRLLLGH